MENINQTVIENKVKKPVNKDSLIIGIVIAVVLILTIGIVAYYFWGINNQVLIKYKGGTVTRGEYELAYRTMAPTYYYYGYDAEYMTNMALTQVIVNELVYDEAVAANATLTEQNKKDIDELFANQDNVKSVASLGIDPQQYKEYVERDQLITNYLEAKKKQATTEQVKALIVAEEGEKADLNVYKTRHILFQFDSEMTDADKKELLKEANNVLAKVKKGEDFAKLAVKYSDDTATATEALGGAFDMLNNDTVVEGYRKAVLKLKAGQVASKVVETDYGYHIIKLDSIEKEGRLTGQSDLDNYINDYVYNKLTEAYDFDAEANQKDLDKVEAISNKISAELGLVSSEE